MDWTSSRPFYFKLGGIHNMEHAQHADVEPTVSTPLIPGLWGSGWGTGQDASAALLTPDSETAGGERWSEYSLEYPSCAKGDDLDDDEAYFLEDDDDDDEDIDEDYDDEDFDDEETESDSDLDSDDEDL